tara:strand:- start:1137 stop:1304 length:168 start_codon:yes stop_codon:yes gene_type:complete
MFEFAFLSFKEAIYMNGHGIYVWSVIGIVVFIISCTFLNYKNKIKKIKKKFYEIS